MARYVCGGFLVLGLPSLHSMCVLALTPTCTNVHTSECTQVSLFGGCNVPSASGGCLDALGAFLSDSLVTETDGDALGIFIWLFV